MDDWRTLAGTLLELAGDHVAARKSPSWVEVIDDPTRDGGLRLRFLDDPVGFFGWRAPPECRAVAVVATGHVSLAEGHVEPPRGLGPGVTPGVRLCCVLAREGQIGWIMRLPDGRTVDQVPEDGRLLDCLRRCFGLPTPPPPRGAGALQTIFWLAAVLEAAEGSEHKLSWSDITRLHPVAEILGAELGTPAPPEFLPPLIRAAGAAWSWEALRQQALVHPWADEVVSPEVARWMDEGMFARWILSALPDPLELIARIRPLVAPAAARRLSHAVRVAAA